MLLERESTYVGHLKLEEPSTLWSNIKRLSCATTLGASFLCANADSSLAQNNELPDPQSYTLNLQEESERNYNDRVREWTTSEDGALMKYELKKAIAGLNDPTFLERQKATENIMRLINTLQEIAYPFPEGFREVLGSELFPSDLYGENCRKELQEKSSCTGEECVRLEQIQAEMKRNHVKSSPRILPGTYTNKELQKALTAQTGFQFQIADDAPHVNMTITERTRWDLVVADWLQELGGWNLDFDDTSNTIHIQACKNPDTVTEIRTPDIYVSGINMIGVEYTAVTRAPKIGTFLQPRNVIFLDNREIKIQGLPRISTIQRCLCDIWKGPADTPRDISRTCIPMEISSARKTKTVPCQLESILLGEYQRVRWYCRESESVWIVTIEIQTTQAADNITGNNSYIDPIEDVIWNNQYKCLDDQGREILPKKPLNESIVSGWNYCEFSLPEKPESIEMTYTPDMHTVELHIPEASLPKNQNP